MNDTHMQSIPALRSGARRTDAHMRREFGYIVAGQITQKLLDRGLITPGEFDRIMAKNRESFSPVIAGLIQSLS